MLILSRRLGEELMIGDDVTVTILGIKGGQVRLGIAAPRTTPVHRKEIYLKARIENGGAPLVPKPATLATG